MLRYLEDIGRERVPDPVGVLHVGVERVAVLAGVVGAERAAGLHVLRVDPGDDVAAANDTGGLREGRVGGRLVPHLEEIRDIVGTLVPYGSAADGLRCRRDRRQRIVVDPHRLRGVFRLGRRFGDHEGDGIAHVADPILRQAPVRRRPHGRAVGTLPLEGHLHGAEAVARHVGSGEDGDDAGAGGGRGGVDGEDPCVRMGRPDDDHVRLARLVDVVMEAALAAEEANVLEALQRLADAELPHPIKPPLVRFRWCGAGDSNIAGRGAVGYRGPIHQM